MQIKAIPVATFIVCFEAVHDAIMKARSTRHEIIEMRSDDDGRRPATMYASLEIRGTALRRLSKYPHSSNPDAPLVLLYTRFDIFA